MRNKKGFTLIELLAVIVILGLLMAIAIPSVTKYIQQSRKKTLMDTMQSYATAVVNGVNDMEYGTLSNGDNLYYIPIECVSLEKGGTDPFGDWKEAYVVVHYNQDEYTYDYYFTYYDSAGYGMELTKIDDLKISEIKNPTEIDKDSITSQTLNGEGIIVLDSSSCNASNTKVAVTDKNSNNKIDVGDKFCIDTECFYVINNDGNNVKALAEYNLLVGNKCTGQRASTCTLLTNATGLQNSSAKGYVSSGAYIGTVTFTSNETNGLTLDLSSSAPDIYSYLINYKTTLTRLGGNIKDITLMTKEEAVGLGCNASKYNCTSAPKWVLNTSYWLKTSGPSNNVWHIVVDNEFHGMNCGWTSSFGVRPVIILATSNLKI